MSDLMSEMLWFPVAIIAVLLLAAMWMMWRAQSYQRVSGLPAGKIVYEDVSHLAHAPLNAPRHGLRGKPDYLLQTEDEALIPVEVKSSASPTSGQPHDGHVLQLAAYFLLIEEALDETAPYGLIRYRNRTLRIVNAPQLRSRLLNTLRRMRTQLTADDVRRNHTQTARCARCSVAHACDQRLVASG
ncbi:MAG: Dna2/Cas4 domain-containing protein [Acidobacteria bacterium]|nr:Dna2/Cas4 domain-containing protein [Acidobacteriota bacterium]